MDIAILGTGNVGSVLGRRLAGAGHQIFFGSREPASERVRLLVGENGNAHQADEIPVAVRHCPVVILAAPWDSASEMIAAAGDLSGKILIDCTNPLNRSFDGLALGYSESAAERIAEMAAGARVVKAFNTVSVATMENPIFAGQAATMFFCGDDADAKQVVKGLIEDLGMEPVDSGPLDVARYLEPLAMLYIRLAVSQGWGGHCALKLLTRSSE